MTDRRRRAGADDALVGELVVAAQADAPWAFDRLYRHFAPVVVGYLRLQGASDPDDLTSEVFLGAFTRIGAFRGDGADFRAWLFTIAHRRLTDDRRRRSRRPMTTALADVPGAARDRVGGDVEVDAFERLGTDRVVRLLAELSVDQRAVLALRILGDLTVEQVGQALGKQPGAVKALQRRGLSALRGRLERQGVPL
jgi:RNA polymerase sigma-70 factor (ECF subfamily)